jgi:ArpU family phage transcriptional regulator
MNYIHEAREFLKHFKDMKIANENLRYKIDEMNEKISEVKGMTISDMPKGGGSNHPDDNLCNAMFERDRCLEALSKNSIKLSRATTIFNKLDKESKEILTMYYIEEEKTDTEIARELGIGRTKLSLKKNSALRKFAIQLFGINAL